MWQREMNFWHSGALKLSNLGQLLQHNAWAAAAVDGWRRSFPQVLRKGYTGLLELGMVPTAWHGKGLLGCHLSLHI